jgi:serine/threonine-protein kinase RsbW
VPTQDPPENRTLDDAAGSTDTTTTAHRADSGGAHWPDGPADETVPVLVRIAISGAASDLTVARQELAAWVAGTGLSEQDGQDLVLASYEAMANAAEHAYPDGVRPVDLTAIATTDGCVLVTVADHGRWRPPPADPGYRGRGLMMIDALAHHAEYGHGPDGTTVRMWWRLPAG